MNKPIHGSVIIIGLLALLAGGIWYWRALQRSNGDAGQALSRMAVQVAPAAAGGLYFKTRFQDESQFIVESTVADVAEMALYAKSQSISVKSVMVEAIETKDSQVGQPRYIVRVKMGPAGFESPLKLDKPIWAPEAYGLIAGRIFETAGIPPKHSSAQADLEFLHSLLQLTAADVERVNIKLSAELERDFLNPSLHEKAAMLEGAFALRENSGDFYEIRAPLCRMAAHLTFARAAGGESPGLDGQVADALLSALMNNEVDALAKTEKLRGLGSDVDAWARIVRARSTHDFRELAKFGQRSVAEDTEYFRALCQSVGTEPAWATLNKGSKIDRYSAFRIVNMFQFSVGLGNIVQEGSLPLELAEAGAVCQMDQGRTLDTNNAAKWFNRVPSGCFEPGLSGQPRVRILGWGQWAMFFQRHLCNAIVRNYKFQLEGQGVPEDAKAFAADCERQFGKLWLYPFVRLVTSDTEASYKKSIDGILQYTKASPHLSPAGPWSYLGLNPGVVERYEPQDLRMISEWHKHNPPPGTVYNPGARLSHVSFARHNGRFKALEELLKAAPADICIARQYLYVNFHGKASAEEREKALHPMLDYDLGAILEVARTRSGEPARYEELMSRAADLNPAAYFELGNYFIGRHEDEKGAEYLEKGGLFCSDTLQTAAYGKWLINYYLDRGEVRKAERLADLCGEVYSQLGLEAQAYFFERQKKYQEALKVYRAIGERYGSNEELIGFFRRYKQATGKTDFDAALRAASHAAFPSGMETVDLKDFAGAPGDGCYVAQVNPLTAQAGLNLGAVIVALDGVRVRNFAQYAFVRSGLIKPELELIVWQNGKYQRITASPPGHKFAVDFADYHTN